jgi:hypothetical protein
LYRQEEKEASMATAELMSKRSATRKRTAPKAVSKSVVARVEEILAQNFAFMDSPIFKNRNIEKELFTFETEEPKLPLTS